MESNSLRGFKILGFNILGFDILGFDILKAKGNPTGSENNYVPSYDRYDSCQDPGRLLLSTWPPLFSALVQRSSLLELKSCIFRGKEKFS